MLYLFEPSHGKTNNPLWRKQRHRSASHCEAEQRLCFHYTDSTIPRLYKTKISSLQPSSVTVQAGLCRTCSENTLLVFPRGSSFYLLEQTEDQIKGVFDDNLSRIMRKTDVCLCVNKGGDQLRSNCTADQHFCFCFSDSRIPFLLISKISIF